MYCSTPGLPVHHQLLEFTHTYVHWVGGAIQPSSSLPSISPLAFDLSQYQGLFLMSCLFASGDQSIGKKESQVTQSCLTLCEPIDCRLPDFSIHGIFQARILEWVAISFSRGSSQPRDQTQVSCIVGRRLTVWATREAMLRSHIGYSKLDASRAAY